MPRQNAAVSSVKGAPTWSVEHGAWERAGVQVERRGAGVGRCRVQDQTQISGGRQALQVEDGPRVAHVDQQDAF